MYTVYEFLHCLEREAKNWRQISTIPYFSQDSQDWRAGWKHNYIGKVKTSALLPSCPVAHSGVVSQRSWRSCRGGLWGTSDCIHIQLMTMYELGLALIGSPGSWDKVALSILVCSLLPSVCPLKKVCFIVICLHSA